MVPFQFNGGCHAAALASSCLALMVLLKDPQQHCEACVPLQGHWCAVSQEQHKPQFSGRYTFSVTNGPATL